MTASNTLKRQIIIEILALIVLVGVICYTAFAIDNSNNNKIKSANGFVTVLDDDNFNSLQILSDGQALKEKGITYTITNNNKDARTYILLVKPNTEDENILNHLKVSVNQLYVAELTSLEKNEKGYYRINTHELKSGYTKVNIINLWYDLDTNSSLLNNAIKFDFDIEIQ